MTTHPKKDPSPASPRTVALVLLASVLTAVAAAVPAFASPAAQHTLTAKHGTADAKFGTSVSIDGNTAVVGAPDEGGVGAAYVFTKRAGTWVEETTLVAPARVDGERFGFEKGAAYVFDLRHQA